MNYYLHLIDAKEARYFKWKNCQFDYIESENFENFKKTNEPVFVVGYIKLVEIEQDDSIENVIIPNGLDNHYFKFHPIESEKSLKPKRILGYISVGANNYVAIYKTKSLLPLILVFILLGIYIIKFL